MEVAMGVVCVVSTTVEVDWDVPACKMLGLEGVWWCGVVEKGGAAAVAEVSRKSVTFGVALFKFEVTEMLSLDVLSRMHM